MRIIRFIKALWKYILYGKKVEIDEYSTRLNICKECDKFNKEKWICNVCGCYLEQKAKMSTEKCPKNKW